MILFGAGEQDVWGGAGKMEARGRGTGGRVLSERGGPESRASVSDKDKLSARALLSADNPSSPAFASARRAATPAARNKHLGNYGLRFVAAPSVTVHQRLHSISFLICPIPTSVFPRRTRFPRRRSQPSSTRPPRPIRRGHRKSLGGGSEPRKT